MIKNTDVSSLGGVLVIIIVSIIFGYVLLHQAQSLSDTVKYTPSGIEEIRGLQQVLHDPEPTPLAATSTKRP